MMSADSTILSFLTNELTSHGVMLFATFGAVFGFLKIITDYSHKKGHNQKSLV